MNNKYQYAHYDITHHNEPFDRNVVIDDVESIGNLEETLLSVYSDMLEIAKDTGDSKLINRVKDVIHSTNPWGLSDESIDNIEDVELIVDEVEDDEDEYAEMKHMMSNKAREFL